MKILSTFKKTGIMGNLFIILILLLLSSCAIRFNNPFLITSVSEKKKDESTISLEKIKISAGWTHQLILDKNGTAWAGGSDQYGQLGGGITQNLINLPFFELTSDVKNIFAGKLYSIIQKNDNTLWGMGVNWGDVLGLGDIHGSNPYSYRQTLTKITDNVKYVSTNFSTTAIIKTDNSLWVNHYGYYFTHTHPKGNHGNLCKVMDNVKVKDISVGSQYYLILKDDNSLWGAGKNEYGQLGLGNYVDKNTFVEITTDAKDIIAGGWYTLILKNDNTLWGTGQNQYGQLGDGNNISNRNTFAQAIINDVKKMHAGGWHTIILKNDNTVWATGSNGNGQLGLGDNFNRNTFVQIMINDVKDIITGHENTLILKNDNTLWGTGYNSSGALGLGDNSNRNTFVEITTDVKDVGASGFLTIILKNDNTLWSTGSNIYGGLGLGNNSNKNTFVEVTTNSINVKSIHTSGYYGSFILKNDDTLWGTGANWFGQLGLGDDVDRNAFIESTTNVKDINYGYLVYYN